MRWWSAHFQDDAYFHLRALQDGYVVVPSSAAEPACRYQIETLRKGSRKLLHLRTENPYFLVVDPWQYVSAFQLNEEFHCLGNQIPDQAYLLWWGDHQNGLTNLYKGSLGPATKSPVISFPPHWLPIPTSRKDSYEVLEIQTMSPESVANLRASAADMVDNPPGDVKTRIDSYSTFEKLTRADRSR